MMCRAHFFEKYYISLFAAKLYPPSKIIISINYFSDPGLIPIEMKFDDDRISYHTSPELF